MENKLELPLSGLKICFIAGTLGVGGAEKQLFYIVTALKKLGAEVSLICLTSGEFWEEPIKAQVNSYYSLKGKGTKLSRIFTIGRILLKVRPKLVQSQHFYTNLYAAAGALFCGASSIGASRNELKLEIKHNGRFGMASVKLPKYFVANSHQSVEQAQILRKIKQNIFYLPNALDLSKINGGKEISSIATYTFTLLAMGRLTAQKRFDKFIKLIAGLKNISKYKVQGIIIGSGELETELKQLAAELDLKNEDLVFIPHTSTPVEYMKKADLFVLTSEYEGTPNVVLEAMATGLPVITTKVGNLPYFINDGENAVFFDGSLDDLLKKANELMNDRDKNRSLGNNSRQTIEAVFSLRALEENLVMIYNRITNK